MAIILTNVSLITLVRTEMLKDFNFTQSISQEKLNLCLMIFSLK
jgi:hypothetical protein